MAAELRMKPRSRAISPGGIRLQLLPLLLPLLLLLSWALLPWLHLKPLQAMMCYTKILESQN